jgi:heavy metal translocating P-type ATPase
VLGRALKEPVIAAIALVAIGTHVFLRFVASPGTLAGHPSADWPLFAALALGGIPLVFTLFRGLLKGDFSSDLLAGISIVTAVLLGEYLAGTLVVLMLSGGQTIEAYAVQRASSALSALASRLPTVAHRKDGSEIVDVPLDEIAPGDTLIVFPHEACPADGVVIEGHSSMDESFLTGEPYVLSKTVGTNVLSGSVNGDGALTIRADKRAVDSRYARIMNVMRESEQRRPKLRRLGDQLGAIYTPIAVVLAIAAWVISGDSVRFLAVLVVATPCPLLIAIPVAIIGSVSLSARRGIIVKDPAVLEQIDACRTAIFDKTGTLTYGKPQLTEILTAPGVNEDDLLVKVASLERYSRHPLSAAIVEGAAERGLALREVSEVSERPGSGLRGVIGAERVQVTGRAKRIAEVPADAENLPPQTGGLECVVVIDGKYAATFRLRDEPRREGKRFIRHLNPRHGFTRVMLVSGDRDSEVRYLADKVGIKEIYADQSPEQKVELVREETRRAPTLFMGDGINDAPALTAATVGIAFGEASDGTTEAAGVVILNSSLSRVDELLHIGRHMRRVALQSAVGGMALSVLGMLLAAAGWLPPVQGAVMQELIDVLAVANALRAGIPPGILTDH